MYATSYVSTWQKLNDGDISDQHTTDVHMLDGNRRRASMATVFPHYVRSKHL